MSNKINLTLKPVEFNLEHETERFKYTGCVGHGCGRVACHRKDGSHTTAGEVSFYGDGETPKEREVTALERLPRVFEAMVAIFG